ncbi:MAG: hypothetical protein RMK15_08040 [Chloroflexota bacterium]|nr:hypothetical protein [Dehalococcoidia bacterium]MDW8047211.1 hypothetical protein [Chloroflexota bacterium]
MITRDGHLVRWSAASPPEWRAAAEALDAQRWERARVVLLDLTDYQPWEGPPWPERAIVWLQRFPLPLVAALAGAVSGPWVDLALAADIRVGAPSLTVTLPGELALPTVERLGLLTRGALPEPGKALSARWLFERGLLSSLAEDPQAEAERIARVIASRGPYAVQLGKEAIWRGLGMPLEQALRFETDLTLLLQTTKDRAEGVRAFLEKRTPHFEGA